MRKHDYFRRYMKMAPDDGGGGASPTPSPSGGDGGGVSGATSSPADGGSSSTPSASDSGASGVPATPEPANVWDSLGSVDDLDSIEIPAAAPVMPTPEPVAPVAPPVATPPAAPTAQPQTPPVAPQPATQEQAPAAPSLSPSDPVGIATAMQAARNDVIAHLAQDRFALTPEDIQELETDAATFVPKMMARVMFEAQTSMMKFLAQAVPGMIGNHTKVTKANSEAENKFFAAHKELGLNADDPSHREVAFRMASLYRQANPNMPLDQLIAEVGPVVAASLRANGKLTAAPAVATTPAAPAMPRGGQPFRPAVNGGGGASPAPAQQSEWAGLGMTFDE